jgi:hypothetical protein
MPIPNSYTSAHEIIHEFMPCDTQELNFIFDFFEIKETPVLCASFQEYQDNNIMAIIEEKIVHQERVRQLLMYVQKLYSVDYNN